MNIGYETTTIDIQRMQDAVKENEVVCVLLNIQEGNSLVKQIGRSKRLNLIEIDIMGKEKISSNKNGYVLMMTNLARQISGCIK
jgi:ABC-type Zn2+ transport system substrate-binding protein/surface adhesin